MGTQGYCAEHLEELLAPIRERVFEQVGLDGAGRLRGVLRPEFGPLVGELQCTTTTCGATWCGSIGMPCPWCERSLELMRDYQAQILLSAPDVAPNDERYDTAMRGWAERLARGVTAGLITAVKARQRLEREVQRAA